MCSPYFFSSAWQTDQAPGAVGQYVTKTGAKTVFIIASNYQGRPGCRQRLQAPVQGPGRGRGVPAADPARLLGRDLADRRDQARRGVRLRRRLAGDQLRRAVRGVGAEEGHPLYSAFTVYGPVPRDDRRRRARRALGGVLDPRHRQRREQAIVEAFRKEYGYVPSNISAQAYESARIIDAAVTQVKGKVEDRDASSRRSSK